MTLRPTVLGFAQRDAVFIETLVRRWGLGMPIGYQRGVGFPMADSAIQPHATVQSIVELLRLEPLGVEGGLFAQTWSANNSGSGDSGSNSSGGSSSGSANRPAGTAIYALFTNEPDSFSALHRLDGTEVWHHYLGDCLTPITRMRFASSEPTSLTANARN